MKILILTVFTFFSSFIFAQTEKDGVLGDFNGDGKTEYAYTNVNDCSEECDGKCETIVYFSDKKIKPFIISQAKNGTLYNLKDLNNDGKDELGFYPNWCTSCWHSFYTYTFSKNVWKSLLTIPTHCSQWEDGKFPIKKDPKKKGHVIVTSSQWKDDDIKIISKSVKVN